MGKRINPTNLRLPYIRQWDNYCPTSNYSEIFGYYIYLQKWCQNLFHYFINLYSQVKNNQIYLTLVVYFPGYYFSKKAAQRFFKRVFRKTRQQAGGRLSYGQKQALERQYSYFQNLYKIQEIFYFRRLFNQYRKYLEQIFTKTLGRKVNVKIINISDLYRNKLKHKKLIAMHTVLTVKLSSFYRRFNRNYKHIVKLFALSSYLHEPVLLVMVIKRLFRVPRRNFLVLRLIKSYLDLIYLFNTDLLGVKFQIKGKFNGSLRTRKMLYQRGQIPLQTINANIKYASDSFTNKVGTFGIRIWYYCGSFDENLLLFTNKKGHDKEIYVKENIDKVQKTRQTMVIKNFFYTWLNYKVREKRQQQKKIVVKKKQKYGSRDRQKITKKQTANKSR